MNKIKACLAPLIVCALTLVTAHAQEASRTVEQSYQFDNRGDATIQFTFQLAARPWVQWKDQYGDHPDILLRNLKYQLAAAVIEDFSLEKDEVHRTAVAKFKARALANYRNGGQFSIKVPKDMKLVSGSGTEWAFTNSALEQGGIINITYRAKLPATAQNPHLITGNDYNQLVYNMDLSPEKPKIFLFAGVLFFGFGVILAIIAFVLPKKNQSNRPAPPPLPQLNS